MSQRTGISSHIVQVALALAAVAALTPGVVRAQASLRHGPIEVAATATPAIILAQNDQGTTPHVPPKEVEKYIAVYRAMQQNHSLTVAQACAQQGITVAAFRGIENKIERNDAIRERVRKALRRKQSPSSGSKDSR